MIHPSWNFNTVKKKIQMISFSPYRIEQKMALLDKETKIIYNLLFNEQKKVVELD